MAQPVSELVLQLLAAESLEKAPQIQAIATHLDDHSITLLEFVQILGPHLTHEADLIRLKSVELLGLTISKARAGGVLRHDVPVLLQFLISQLSDSAVVASALQLLLVLAGLSVFSASTDIPTLLEALNDKYVPTKYLAKVRFQGLHLLEVLLPKVKTTIRTPAVSNPVEIHDPAIHVDTHVDERNNHLDGERILSVTEHTPADSTWLSFAKTFVNIATGEKDPRNLLVSFGLNKEITSGFPFSQPRDADLLADLFDVAFCYFPISFTPPANDPYGITADHLKVKLRSALVAHRLSADDLFSSLIEKLTLTNPSVRNDVLQTILEAIINFQPDDITPHWLPLWNAFKYEILHNDVSIFKPEKDTIIPVDYLDIDNSDDTKPLFFTLDIVKNLAAKLEAAKDYGTAIDKFLELVFSELNENLSKVSTKVFSQSVLLVAVIGSASLLLYNKVVDFLLSYKIWGKYIGIEPKEDEKEKDVSAEITEKSDDKEIEITSQDVEDDLSLSTAQQRLLIDNLGFVFNAYVPSDENHLFHFKDHLLVFNALLLRTSSSLEKTLKSKIVVQLGKMAILPGFLTADEWSNVLTWFDEVLKNTIESNTASWNKDHVVVAIRTTIVQVVGKSWPRSNAVVENVLPTLLDVLNKFIGDEKSFSKVLNFIGEISVNPQILETLSVRLLRNLEIYSTTSPELFLATAGLLVECVNKTQSELPFNMSGWYKSFVPRFLEPFFQAVSQSGENSGAIVEVCGDLIGLIIRYVDKDKHQGILNDLSILFFEKKNILGELNVLINFFIKVVTNIDKSSKLEGYSVDELISKVNTLLGATIQDQNSDFVLYINLGYLQFVALLANKFDDGNLQIIDKILSSGYESISSNFEINTNVQEFAWVLKGIIVKIDKRGLDYLERIVRLLSTDSGMTARNALIYQVLNIATVDLPIFTDSTPAKKKLNKLVSGVQSFQVRGLYKQRLFAVVFPILLNGYTESTDLLKGKLVYLKALAILFSNVPLSVLIPYLQEFTPMVLSSLQISEGSVSESLLKTIEVILKESPISLVPHFLSLIPRLVSLSLTLNKINTEEIQLSALRCLLLVFQLTEERQKLMRYQKETLSSLIKGLDDPKRSVRKLVTDVRQMLYQLR